MTTVKEFKDLGLTPIIGDEYTFMDRKNIEYFKSIRGSDESWAGQLETDRGIYDDDQLDMLTPLSFSWRPNTGVKPAFKGLIDICFEDGTISYGEENLFEWSLDDESFISKWRPSLDQSALKPVNGAAVKPSDDKPVFTPWSETYSSDKLPKIKPVFTQAMADAGELPPVGSDFLHAKKVVTCLSVSDYDGGVVTFAYNDRDGQEVDIDCCWNNDSWVQPIDTRTPKQKSVDAIQEVICSQGWLSKERVSKEIAEKLYDAGYRKC